MKPAVAQAVALKSARMLALLLAGMLAGALLVSAGWAAAPKKSTPKKKPLPAQKTAQKKPAKAVANKPAKKPVAQGAKPAPFKPFAHPKGYYQLNHPASWKLSARQNAMVMHSASQGSGRGVFGIVRRSQGQSNEDAITAEFTAQDRPPDLTQTSARVAGLSAIKVVGSGKDNPGDRVVEYYLQNHDGQQYYILMMAPRKEWQRYATTFNTMLGSLNFN